MKHWYLIVGTFFGVGKSPWFPGTLGSAAGLLILWSLSCLIYPVVWATFSLTLFFILGVLASKRCAEWTKCEDPREVVVDEVVGIFIALLGISMTGLNALLGFVFFRLFDIWKPYPIRKLEALPNGWGVMLDDVLAGVYANLAVRIILWVI